MVMFLRIMVLCFRNMNIVMRISTKSFAVGLVLIYVLNNLFINAVRVTLLQTASYRSCITRINDICILQIY